MKIKIYHFLLLLMLTYISWLYTYHQKTIEQRLLSLETEISTLKMNQAAQERTIYVLNREVSDIINRIYR